MLNEPDHLPATRWSLINRLKNLDDQDSWREFFDTYWKLIYGMATKSGLTSAEAQDVVQETVISVCKNINRFKAEPSAGSFKSWLLRLTRWRIVDQFRRRGPTHQALPHGIAEGVQSDSPSTQTECKIPDPASQALEAMWDDEWKRNLTTAALARVQRQTSAKHYQIFYLHMIREIPAEKVARVTAVTVDQVDVIKHQLMPMFQQAVNVVEHKGT